MKLALIASLLLSGCAYSIHQVQVSEFRPSSFEQKGKQIRAESQQFTVMGFVQQTDYVDQAYQDLAAKCPNGEVTGITNQFSTSLGFFSWTNKILLQGLCVPMVASNDNQKSKNR